MRTGTQRVQSRRTAALLVLGLALLFFLPALGTPVVQREQELRVALTARSMAEGGNWLIPDYLGQMRLRKPPLMYWAVAASYRLGGATDSAWLARLPSALSGAALALVIFFIGSEFMGRRRAFLSAFCCATSLIVLRQARVAETDIPLTLWTTLALWSGYRALFKSAGWKWMLLAAISSGLGFLTKGPAAFVLPFFAWIVFAFAPGFRSIHRPRASSLVSRLALWLIVALVIASPWYIYLWARAGSLTQLRLELSATFGETTQHPGPWYYYFYSLLQAFLPWSLALPFALRAAWRKAMRNAAQRFLLIWFATTFLALSLTSSKQIHYCTLLIPPVSLLVGWYLGAIVWNRARSARFRILCASVIALFAAAHLVAVSIVQPRIEPKQALRFALETCLPEVHEAERVLLVGRHRGTIEFHAGRAILDMDSVKEAWRQSKSGDIIIVNTTRSLLPALPPDAVLLASAQQRDLQCAIWRRI